MNETKIEAALSDKAWRKGEMLNSHFSSARYFWYWFEGVSVAMPEVVGDAILADHEIAYNWSHGEPGSAQHDLMYKALNERDAITLALNALSERLTLMTLDRDKWKAELAEKLALEAAESCSRDDCWRVS